MKLFECFAATGYHTCIATTFDLSFDAWESMALPRLREANSNNNVVVADARMVALALSNRSGLPKYAGRRYSVVDASLSGSGVYHPKMILQLGRDAGRLIVGSANLTAPGLAGNLEIVGEVVVTEDDRSAVPLLRAALASIAAALDASAQTARQQIDWAVEKTPWLKYGVDSREPIPDEAGGLTSLLLSGEAVGIAEQFRALVEGERVRRLVVMSPYWDSDLAALKWFQSKLKPAQTCLLIQPRSKLFPVHALSARSELGLYDIGNLRRASARFPHAKLFIAQTSKADHVLFGSANCTRAALGDEQYSGSNGEASLYRRMPPSAAVERLELANALDQEALLAVSDLPNFERAEDIPLDDVQDRLAGRFEVRSGTLRWWPKPSFDHDDAIVDLFDEKMVLLQAGSRQVSAKGFRTVAHPNLRTPAAFAVVRRGALESALAVVTVDAEIYANQQRARSSKIRSALEHFSDEEATEGLWILEVLDDIHRAEAEEVSDVERMVGSRKPEPSTQTDPHRTLTYEDFIRARPAPGGAAMVGESTMSTSYVDAVRSALNFFLGRGRKPTQEEEDGSAAKFLDMGDETSDGEDAVESGADAASPQQGPRDVEAARKRAIQRRHKYYRDTAKKIVKAVTAFEETTREKALKEGLTGLDLLRLRALLMIVLTAGTNRLVVVPPDVGKPMSRVQVLPIQGDDGWPRLVMRLLFAYFFRRPSLLSMTRVPLSDSGELPVDVAECLASCFWAACAVDTAVDQRGVPRASTGSLAQSLYSHIALDKARASSDTVHSMMKALSKRLALRLGVNDERQLLAVHLRAVRAGDRQFQVNAG